MNMVITLGMLMLAYVLLLLYIFMRRTVYLLMPIILAMAILLVGVNQPVCNSQRNWCDVVMCFLIFSEPVFEENGRREAKGTKGKVCRCRCRDSTAGCRPLGRS